VEEHKEEINKLTLQLSGETEAGKGRYIGLYQAAVKQVVGKLSEEQVEKYKKLVEEYNRTGPPKELQRK
jgi:hypothetical protein